jgi:hypothetical protein
MDRFATIESVLVEFDGPQLLVARDRVGTSYLCLLGPAEHNDEVFLCVPVSRSRLAALRMGMEDLRSVYTNPESVEYYEGTAEAGDSLNSTILRLQQLEAVVPSAMPADGFFLTPAAGETGVVDSITARALVLNRAVVRLSLKPVEAIMAAVIDAQRLADALSSFQEMVRYAFRRAIARMPDDIRSMMGDEGQYALEVFGVRYGSFEVHLRAKSAPDMFGKSGLGRALETLDDLTKDIEYPALALEAAKRNKGLVIHSFQSFLKFVAESGTPVEFSWADPATPEGRPHVVTPASAEALYALLTSREELSKEDVTHVGAFDRVAVSDGGWTIKTPQGKEIKGRLHEDADSALLSGIITVTQLYELACEERVEETAGTGRHSTRLYLRYLRPVDPSKLIGTPSNTPF